MSKASQNSERTTAQVIAEAVEAGKEAAALGKVVGEAGKRLLAARTPEEARLAQETLDRMRPLWDEASEKSARLGKEMLERIYAEAEAEERRKHDDGKDREQ